MQWNIFQYLPIYTNWKLQEMILVFIGYKFSGIINTIITGYGSAFIFPVHCIHTIYLFPNHNRGAVKMIPGTDRNLKPIGNFFVYSQSYSKRKSCFDIGGYRSSKLCSWSLPIC